jgi:mutator protein MutT
MEKVNIVAVIALIKNDEGKVLAQKRNHPEFPEVHELWEVPGGKVEYDEIPEQAVVRETKEETGLDVEVVSLWPRVFVKYWTKADKSAQWKTTLIVYVCNIVGGQLFDSPTDPHISQQKFVNAEELNELDFGAREDKNILLEFLRS